MSPTKRELSPIEQLIVLAVIVTMPVLTKGVLPTEALIGKLVAKLGFVTLIIRSKKVFAAKVEPKTTVAALLEVE